MQLFYRKHKVPFIQKSCKFKITRELGKTIGLRKKYNSEIFQEIHAFGHYSFSLGIFSKLLLANFSITIDTYGKMKKRLRSFLDEISMSEIH